MPPHELPTFVYMLRCADGSFYTGITRRPLEERISEHNRGALGGYTAVRRPVQLVWSQEFHRVADAIAAERRIKGVVAPQETRPDRRRLGPVEASGEERISSGKGEGAPFDTPFASG